MNNIDRIRSVEAEKTSLGEISDLDFWDPMDEDFNSSRNTLALNPNKDPLSLVTGQVRPIASKIGELTICDHFAKYGECADGDYCDRVHIDPLAREKLWALQRTIELNKNRLCLDYTYLTPNEIPANNDALLMVTVTNIKSPGNFYFVAPYNDFNFSNLASNDLDFYLNSVTINSPIRRRLDQIHLDLQAIFDHKYRVDNVNDNIYKSQIVACKLKDNQFRRAMVIDVPDLAFDKFEYRLLLLDVGSEVDLPREMIYDIKASNMSEAPAAINARLDVKPPNKSLSWPESTISFIKDFCEQKVYMFCKVSYESTMDRMYTVDLFNMDKRESLTKILIDKGLAEKCEF